jgi:hypothetical protein
MYLSVAATITSMRCWLGVQVQQQQEIKQYKRSVRLYINQRHEGFRKAYRSNSKADTAAGAILNSSATATTQIQLSLASKPSERATR